jgi:aryl-alcohol dehydrogenase-like predicted oxidoreductase
MPLRQIDIPSLGRRLSNVMAHPSSADEDTHEAGLDEYRRLGGNCIHLHGEGGETHSRRAVGQWLRRHRLRPDFFLATQICHDGWDETTELTIVRLTPEAVSEDIATDLELLGTSYLDFVYFADDPRAALEPVIEAIAREMARGRIRAFGVRNCPAERIRAVNAYALRLGIRGIGAVVTTELALPVATRPLWPEDIPFDATLEEVIRAEGLAVFAHADDMNLGQCVFEAKESAPPQYAKRWDHPANPELVQRVQKFAAVRGLTPREVNLAWLLNQRFPDVAMASLPSWLTNRHTEYERASWLLFNDADRHELGKDLRKA